jgi:hypothetical protein
MYSELLKKLFMPEQVVQILSSLPPVKFPVMESVFSDRMQLPFASVAKEDILSDMNELPVVRRGFPAYEINNDSYEVTTYEPLPVRHSQMIYAKELNDLKGLNHGDQAIWVKNMTDKMRRRYLKTVEALCAIALTGKIEWPMHEPGGMQPGNYFIDFGQPYTLEMSALKLWGDSGAKIVDVFAALKAMRKLLRQSGFGAELEIWAGENAYERIVAMAQVHPEKSSLSVTIDENGINVAGYVVKERAETFRYPQTDVVAPVVPANDVMMIAREAGHKLIYCAVDDLDAKLNAMPFFIKIVKKDDPSGIKLISEGKPFPVVNVKGICRATVVSE